MTELKPFLNEKLQLTAWPARNRKKLHALYYLAQKLEAGRLYTERELGDLLDDWHTFHDPATLRREMYTHRLIDRSRDGRSYWAEPLPHLETWLAGYL
jgi:hypothetical protein